jgi:class 3 adenylate cyclase
VTVLLAVLKDSMDLMVDRNPEEARYLLDSVVDRMLIFIDHYEGTVELTG